ncbi:MAG: alcohol dehydrogenase catalytic domain-containing protein [Candidatus Marinimicrobia bacterium]|nr:alcohol dehydrogenase catalytic domain-containing protein [Candidatus Neomarinimicrobiota bacterium]
MMKAVQFNGKSLNSIERALRVPQHHEVLLRVQACGVCGTDVKILKGESEASPPVILGHEFCGIAEKTGERVTSVKPGDTISVDPNIHCGHCRFCRKGKINLCENLTALGVNIDGGFATHCYVPESQCYHIPPDLPPEQAALMEPLSCALYGFQKACINPGDAVVIMGGGIIGILMLKLARLSPALMVLLVEPDENRRNYGMSLGADAAFNPHDPRLQEKIHALTQGGADCVIECVGNIQAVKTAYSLLSRGGHLILFGVTHPEQSFSLYPYELFKNDIRISGSFLNPGTFQPAIDLVQSKKITLDDIEIKTFPLTEIEHAIGNQTERKSLKTVVTMNP